MKRLMAIGTVGIAWTVLVGGGAAAQQPSGSAGNPAAEFGARAPAPPAPRPELELEPTRPLEEVGTREQEFYPGQLIRSRHQPAFVRPFVTDVPTSETSMARIGFGGWTAPAVPYDAPDSGGVAFGLTIHWGAPRRETRAPAGAAPEER